MTIYIDIVLIENIFMNYIILLATATITKPKIRYIRILLASTLGAIYSVVNFISDIANNFILKIMLSISMIYLAFVPENIKKCIKELLIFYVVSFTFGGTAYAIMNLLNSKKISNINPQKYAILGGILGFFLIILAFKIIKNKYKTQNNLCKIQIKINQNKIESIALIDTGNLLKDPITLAPVIIVETSLLKNIIPKEILENVNQIIQGNKIEIPKEYLNKLRIIPYKAVGTENGLLLGIKADGITIEIENEIIEKNNVIIGLYTHKLSTNNKYTSLIGTNLIERGKIKNEFNKNIKN